METKKVKIDYYYEDHDTKKSYLHHSYTCMYMKTGLFCPMCGTQSVWVEKGNGDYYQGPTHACHNCFHLFTLPRLYKAVNKSDRDLINQLRSPERRNKNL